jgi:arylsulfatase A-like enzyme
MWMMATGLTFRHRTASAILSGILVGGLAGGIENLGFTAQASARGGMELLYALGLYGALGAVAGLALGIVWAMASGIGMGWAARRGVPSALAFHAALFALFLIGYRLNQSPGMPPALSTRGLLYNGALAAIVIVLAVVLAALLGLIRADAWRRVQEKLGGAFPVLVAIPVLLLVGLTVRSLAVSVGGGPGAGGTGISDRERPNVIILLIDALRKDHVSGYGYERRTTLALDHLMDESVVFDNAYAHSNWTVPSVASLFTGVSAVSHGVLSTADDLPEDIVTLPEALGESGYVCGGFFGNAILDIGGGFDRGFRHRHPRPKPFWCYHMHTAVERVALRLLRGGHYFRGEVVLGMAEAWIEANRERPFFAYIHFMEPHSPYEPPPPYDTMFDAEYDGPPMREPPLDRVTANRGFRDWEAQEPGVAAIGEEQRYNMVALYDGEIAFTDSMIEGFLKKLQTLGLYDTSIIVVTADHGEEFFEHGGWFHGQSLYDELVRVPLIVKLPHQAQAGTRREEVVSGLDLLPSILKIAGLPASPGVEGRDVLMSDARSLAGRPVFLERPPFLYGVVMEGWKLVRKEVEGSVEHLLFDTGEDPDEIRNVADLHPEIVDRLGVLVEERSVTMAARAGADSGEELDPYERERLKALGYIQ